jgi:5-formyltetrahydrofolate cyclo-ligase
VNERPRLLLADLVPLAVFLFGARWQTALAGAVHRSPRMVRRWAADERPISAAASQRIVALVRDKHSRQMAWQRATYLAMIGALSASPLRAQLLAMDLPLVLPQVVARPPAQAHEACRTCARLECAFREAAE